VAGGLYAHQIGLIDPSKFDFNRSVEILVMVVLGGMGSITGSIISAGVLTVLPEALRGFASYRMLLYSIVLICVMLFRPTGLLGRSEFSLMKTVDKIKGAVKGKKQDPASNKEG
jgi:branched-chain amino acid transport system permease protein